MDLPVVLNLAACAVLFWVAGTFLVTRDEANTFAKLALQGALLGVMVGAMIAAVAQLRYGSAPPWWTLLQRIGAAAIALYLYDLVFSIKAQARHLWAQVTGIPRRLRQRWQRALEHAHRAAHKH